MLSIREETFKVIKNNPGIGSNALAAEVGIVNRNARRAAKELAAWGLISITGDQVSGFRYWPSDGASAGYMNAAPEYEIQQPEPIDADFREVSESPSARRMLTVHHGASQPFDSRMAAALAQHARAQSRPAGLSIPAPVTASWDAMFALPDEASMRLRA